jgi:hypothetical protein
MSTAKRAKYLERVHILRTLINQGPLSGIELADRANQECDHDAFETLPAISRRGIGQKLSAMALDGLVVGTQAVRFAPLTWAVTDRGRAFARVFEYKEGQA